MWCFALDVKCICGKMTMVGLEIYDGGDGGEKVSQNKKTKRAQRERERKRERETETEKFDLERGKAKL